MMAMNTGGRKIFNAKPPDKGSFPLDHDGECKAFMQKYMTCLQAHKGDNHSCREESKAYLECRMQSVGLPVSFSVWGGRHRKPDAKTNVRETTTVCDHIVETSWQLKT